MAKSTYRKRKLFPLYAPSDAEAARPILDALKARGFSVAEPGEEPGKGGVMLLFLTERLGDEGAVMDTFFGWDAKGVDTVPVNLDGSKPPELIENALYSRNTIFAERYSLEELSERIATAKPFERGKKPLPILLGAAAVLVLAGVVLLVAKLLPAKQTAATDTPPAPTAEPVIPQEAGITAEDLESVHELIVMGDTLYYFTGREGWVAQRGWARVGAEYFANRTEEEGKRHWYSNEDGHEIETAEWSDLDFLRYMKNVKFITLVRVAGELPDLSGLERLDTVELLDCDVTSLNGLKNARIVNFGYSGNSLTDFSPLSACDRLRWANLTLFDPIPADLTSFGPPKLTELMIDTDSSARSIDLSGLKNCPELINVTLDSLPLTDLDCLSACKKLRELELVTLPNLQSLNGLQDHQSLTRLKVDYRSADLRDMSALADNTSLKSVELHNDALSDLSWLENAKNLEELELWGTKSVRNLHGLEDHKKLNRIFLEGLNRLTDLSALESCTGLNRIHLFKAFALSDISPIVKLPSLKDLALYGTDLHDVSFLWDVVNKNHFSFGIAEVEDWSGLEAIKNYNYLNVTDRTGSALPYIKDATINEFELWSRSGYSDWSREPLDWSLFPQVTQNLTLHGVVSLEGMPALPITGLFIDDSQTLTSLDGVENLEHAGDGMLWMNVKGCPRLTDWSALEGMKLAEICCENTFTLPNFAAIDTGSIKLMEPVDLYDLHCFDGMDPDRSVSIELFQTMDVTDLSPLYGLKKGYRLQVPAHLGEQAALLVESGNFRAYEIVYPDEWWEPAAFDVKLLSFDELDTLPSAVLRRVKDLHAVGDVVFSWEEYWLDQQWEDGKPTFVLRSNDGDKNHDIVIDHPGTMTDFSKLSKLTGLEHLNLIDQSLTSIEGIQNLQALKDLKLLFTPTLTDASPAFTLQGLEELRLQYTGVTSLMGVQNLQKLRFADFNGLTLDDLAPLGALPEDCELFFEIPLMTVDEFFALPDSILSRVREIGFFGNCVTKDPWGELWLEQDWDGGDRPDLYLHDNATGERFPIGEGSITNLGFLNRLPNLETLYLYGQPIESVDGIGAAAKLRRFQARWAKLSDLSPLFDLESLEVISVEDTEAVTSIEGVQKLPHLTDLNIGGNGLTDISAIAKIDYTFCMTPEEDGNVPCFILGVDNLQGKIPDEQYGVLAAVPEYQSLNVFNTDCRLWMDAVKDVKIHEIHAGNCRFTNESFRQFVEQHPELEYVKVSWTPELTDVSPLLTLSNLRGAGVSNNMPQAIRSLGDGYGFTLEIE